ncbi:hypothetical protein B0H15DRAFT_860738 [Mycena belliarum]|uniref:Uncharacterized protein n=1 Tax=Mycena belliarum TaxID=1033014 RepID=A0AAD6XJ27_9AGAR|nr:hypothetical protein B0H15DRAFT_860738 [Mycena belliae]
MVGGKVSKKGRHDHPRLMIKIPPLARQSTGTKHPPTTSSTTSPRATPSSVRAPRLRVEVLVPRLSATVLETYATGLPDLAPGLNVPLPTAVRTLRFGRVVLPPPLPPSRLGSVNMRTRSAGVASSPPPSTLFSEAQRSQSESPSPPLPPTRKRISRAILSPASSSRSSTAKVHQNQKLFLSSSSQEDYDCPSSLSSPGSSTAAFKTEDAFLPSFSPQGPPPETSASSYNTPQGLLLGPHMQEQMIPDTHHNFLAHPGVPCLECIILRADCDSRRWDVPCTPCANENKRCSLTFSPEDLKLVQTNLEPSAKLKHHHFWVTVSDIYDAYVRASNTLIRAAHDVHDFQEKYENFHRNQALAVPGGSAFRARLQNLGNTDDFLHYLKELVADFDPAASADSRHDNSDHTSRH